MAETRETFAGLAGWEVALWYVLSGLSTATFVVGVALLARKYRRGRRDRMAGPRARRLVATAWIVLSHAWIRRRAGVTGAAHAAVFYGFLILFLGTVILAFQEHIADRFFGWNFWRGSFYLGYSLFLDVFGMALLAGLAAFALWRGVGKPARLSYRRVDRPEDGRPHRAYAAGDWGLLGTLAFLGASGFLLEAVRIAWTDPPFETWAPFGWAAGRGLAALGVEGDAAAAMHHAVWWVHGVAALAFVAAIPFTKALHMLAGPSAVAVRDDAVGRRLPPLPAGVGADAVGYQRIGHFSPRHLLDLDACTRCGKCHAVCPATASGYPLSPRDLVLDLRELAEGSLGIRAAAARSGAEGSAGAPVAEAVQADTLWSCMQCMACVDICPVGIEHVPMIVEMRRGLIEHGELDAQLQGTLETIFRTGNSFGEPGRKRPRWARELPFEIRDARRQHVDVLWFVGDTASFDRRNQRNTQALARILEHAGVEFGILFDGERSAGNDVRRVGEEGLFASLAEQNIATLRECSFDRILTSDPHTYNTLKNEYPELGAPWTGADVIHHAELLLELIESGRLAFGKPLAHRVTYHDPCALGRFNGVYEQPRAVMRSLGVELVEMPRNRDSSFCCGAGGGRIWMKEVAREGGERPSESRIREAVALGGVERFVVACPKDVTMYEDAIKTSGHEGTIELRELSELVLEALALPAAAAEAGGTADASGA